MNDDVPRLVELWLASTTLTRRSVDTYSQEVSMFTKWASDVSLDVLKAGPADILAFRAHMQAARRAERTITRRIDILGYFYSWLQKAGHVASNPTTALPRTQRPPAAQERLSLQELQTMWLASSGHAGERAAIGLLGICCLGVQEACDAEIGHLTMRDGYTVLRLPKRTSVVPGGEFVPLPRDVEAAVRQHIGERTSGPILMNNLGMPIGLSSLRAAVRRLARWAGIQRSIDTRMVVNTGRWLAVEHRFGLAATLALLPTLDGRPLKPYLGTHALTPDRHPSHRLERIVAVDTPYTERLLDQAEALLQESEAPPAAAVGLAGGALENHLRLLTRSTGRTVNEQKADLSNYVANLCGAGVLAPRETKRLGTLADMRNDAAHGWFDKINEDDAQGFLAEVRRITRSYPLP